MSIPNRNFQDKYKNSKDCPSISSDFSKELFECSLMKILKYIICSGNRNSCQVNEARFKV